MQPENKLKLIPSRSVWVDTLRPATNIPPAGKPIQFTRKAGDFTRKAGDFPKWRHVSLREDSIFFCPKIDFQVAFGRLQGKKPPQF